MTAKLNFLAAINPVLKITHHINSAWRTRNEKTQSGRQKGREMVVEIHTATARLSVVKLSSSVPTDMPGSKMAPKGSTKDTVKLS